MHLICVYMVFSNNNKVNVLHKMEIIKKIKM